MDRELRPHVLTAIVSFLWFVLQAIIGGWLESSGRIKTEDINMTAYVAVNALFFVALTGSIIRPAIRAFVVVQTKIGNGNRKLVQFVRNHERGLTRTSWFICIAGLAVALIFVTQMGPLDR